MILRRFYITENTNGVLLLTTESLSLHLLTSPNQAPIPRSKVNRLLKTDIHPKQEAP